MSKIQRVQVNRLDDSVLGISKFNLYNFRKDNFSFIEVVFENGDFLEIKRSGYMSPSKGGITKISPGKLKIIYDYVSSLEIKNVAKSCSINLDENFNMV